MKMLTPYISKFHLGGWLVPIGAGIGGGIDFLFGSQMLFYVFIGLIFADLITGIGASLKKGEHLNSTKLRAMFFKLMAYMSVLLVAGCMDLLLVFYGITPWLHVVTFGWVILSESVSVLENSEFVLGAKIPLLKKAQQLLDALRNGAKNENSRPPDNPLE